MPTNNKSIDILLVHVYWFDYKSNNLLDMHGQLQLLAINELAKKHTINNIALVGGKIDPKITSIGSVMQKLIQGNSKNIIIKPKAKTTRQEVKKFQKLTEKNDWENITVLAVSTHLPRVKRAYKRLFNSYDVIKFVSAENVLTSTNRTEILNKYSISKDLKVLKFNELLVNLIDGIPLVGGALVDILIFVIPNKGSLYSKFISSRSNTQNSS